MNNTFNEAISSVQLREYIVGSIDQKGHFSIASTPATHSNLQLALAECERLAKLSPGKVFVAMNLAGARVANTVISL